MNKWLNRVSNLFLLLLCSESLMALLQESFHLTIAPKTYGWLALLCGFLWAAFFFRRGFLPGMAAAGGVWWYLLHSGMEKLRPGLLDFLRTVRSVWSGVFPGEGGGAALHVPVEDHSLLLLMLLFLMAAYLASVLSGANSRVVLSLLLSLPFAALCLAVNREPPVLPLVGLALFWLGLLISGDAYRPHDAAGLAVLLTLLPCLAVLAIALRFHNPANYVPDDRALQLTQRLEELSGTLSTAWDRARSFPQILRGFGPKSDALSGWGQGQDGLDLTQAYDFSARANEVFTFRSNADGSLYLRGRSLGAYTGTGWQEAVEQPGFQALDYAAHAVSSSGSAMVGRFEIEAERAYDERYLPYFSISGAEGDLLVPADGETSYSGQFFLPTGGGFGPLPEDLQQKERQYRAFVKDYYTRLPEDTLAALVGIAALNGLNATDSDILAKVASFVSQGSVYDLGVKPYPGDDYAVYFLQTARRGYCIHYATAACCLYRALGFPARLCEGFLVNSRPGRETTVRAADAHAWVEVWLDGVGWIPVEATFASAPARESAAPLPDESETGQTEDTGEQAGPGSTPAPSDPERFPGTEDGGDAESEDGGAQIERPAETETPQVTADGDGDHESETASSEKEASTPQGGPLPYAIGFVAAILLTVAGRYAFLRRRLRRWLTEPDGRRRAVYQYRQAQRILRFGGEMPEAVLTAAEKASFSPHTVSEEELRRSLEALNNLTAKVQSNLRPLPRLLFRYRLGL